MLTEIRLFEKKRKNAAFSRSYRFLSVPAISALSFIRGFDMSDTRQFVSLHPEDNVLVAVIAIQGGQELEHDGSGIRLQEDIPAGHKFACKRIAPGDAILKFGQIIGFASKEIEPGQWVHVHNVTRGDIDLDHQIAQDIPETVYDETIPNFQGYRRANGKAGTRNYIAVISTVNCSATSARMVVNQITPDILARYPHVDGVIALTHEAGCAFEFQGSDHEQLNRTLAGYANHPNVCGYLVLGLGCETAQGSYLIESHNLVQLNAGKAGEAETPSLLFNIQDQGGVAKTVKRALEVIPDLLQQANQCRREPIPISELIVATECGGSDGYSGITANPAIGYASDRIVRSRGTVILSEVPEIYGGEHLLTRRAVSVEVGEKLLERIRWWEDYAQKFNQQIDNNPSVGNKRGGLTTIYEKSLGAISKAGTTALCDVYTYAEPVTQKGLVVMDTPGYDPASVTGMIAGGATVSLFSTGRGSCYGSKPTPTIKICSNTATFERLQDDMDVNAGEVLRQGGLKKTGEEIFQMIIDVASGKQTKSEQQDIGDEEFCPWSPGPIF